MGNITEILNLLDKKIYNDIQLQENYNYLIDKWGEWTLGAGKGGFVINYVDVGNALFSGLMRLYTSLTLASFCISIVFGKLVFPLLSKMYKSTNDEMVDMATLASANKIDELSKVKKKEGWF